MKNEGSWIFISVFPNLIVNTPFETKYAIIVPFDDARVELLRKAHNPINELLESFVDLRCEQVKPSILLLHKKAYSNKSERHSAIIAFRNIIALNVILNGWISVINSKHSNIFTTLFSDYYDLFPLNGFGDQHYLVKSPALSSIVSKANVKYQSSYSLPNTDHLNLSIDKELFDALIYLWEDYFVNRNRTHFISSLFRSLQIAFSACKMPTDNFSTFYDYGAKVGLWISSFEILFHPGGKGKIGYKDIIAELNKYELLNQKIKKTYTINSIQTNIVGLVYKEINSARNDFFHGNNIDKNGLYLFKKENFPLISHIAPVLFLMALKVFLKKKNILADNEHKSLDENVMKYIMSSRIEDIFIKITRKKIPINFIT